MKKSELQSILSGEILDEGTGLTLGELCRVCQLPAEEVTELVEYGVVEPLERGRSQWRFEAVCIRRIHRARRLQQDLGVNIAGAALALDLLEEMEQLRARLQRLEGSKL